MSLDIYLLQDACSHCGRGEDELFWKNYTHNVTPMWGKAGVYDALYMSEGRKAKEYIEVLERGVKHFEENFAEYLPLNPANGWGSAETALPWLREVLEAFKQWPDATIHVSK